MKKQPFWQPFIHDVERSAPANGPAMPGYQQLGNWGNRRQEREDRNQTFSAKRGAGNTEARKQRPEAREKKSDLPRSREAGAGRKGFLRKGEWEIHTPSAKSASKKTCNRRCTHTPLSRPLSPQTQSNPSVERMARSAGLFLVQ